MGRGHRRWGVGNCVWVGGAEDGVWVGGAHRIDTRRTIY